MDYRLGTCSSCGAQYKIPASFVPNQARCRSCTGVVEIGPIRAASEPIPERRPAIAAAADERERPSVQAGAETSGAQGRVASDGAGRSERVTARGERLPDRVEPAQDRAAKPAVVDARAVAPTEATKPPPDLRSTQPRSSSAPARRDVVEPAPAASRAEAAVSASRTEAAGSAPRRRASEPARRAPAVVKKSRAPVVAITAAVVLGLAAVGWWGWWTWSGTREADARAADKKSTGVPSGDATHPGSPGSGEAPSADH